MIPQPTPAAPPRPARILIVDDSAVMRALLRSVVSSDSRLEVAGTASDGASALRVIDSVRPDLILLDVEMPVMDGLSTLRQIRARPTRIPVIMCSSLTQRGAQVTIEALASGASDYVAKPTGQPSREAAVQALAQDLVPKILALTALGSPSHGSARGHASAFPLSSPAAPPRTPVTANLAFSTPPQQPPSGFAPAAVLIGVSTGGPAALDLLLPGLPAAFPLPILIVQHMPELFTKHLAERLDSRCPLRVHEAAEGEPVRPGHIYIAKGDWHMEVSAHSAMPDHHSSSAPVLRLTRQAPENHCRPSVDVLFRTAAAVYSGRLLGVILTGMGHDGLAGSRILRQHGGVLLAQDEPTSAVWGMPGAVAQAGLANRILPLNAIASEILRLSARSQREAPDLRETDPREAGASGIGWVTP
ncbi:protein-glutamate methylesterase/protein-glutamine glutaminase [Acidicapsa acidisoli]|uniref:protein-glutamate methylesterase/protein-glutamine glutaminase n=1 Tax=Acidicapsa acidisoli TaxID=1615681 RepID=UPI0021DFFA26|nr:chemotaxis response regulator protein-glutamate methylesterase [Acidicapsa acidisoli]